MRCLENDRASKKKDWLDSKAANIEPHISACDLSHIREDGKLRYKKEGNAVHHAKKDVQRLKRAIEK